MPARRGRARAVTLHPRSAAAAVRALDRVVLIAGGYDKGVDLAPMSADRDRVRVLIAVGDTAPAVEAAFAGVAEIYRAERLDDAVELSRRHARRGDSILLSPGCASFDQYPNFEARGDDFRRLVLAAHAEDDTGTRHDREEERR